MSRLLPHPGLASDSLECVYQSIHLGRVDALPHGREVLVTNGGGVAFAVDGVRNSTELIIHTDV